MEKPRSKYVRDVIKGLPFTEDNRKYVHDLVTIEHFVTKGPRSMAEGMFNAELRRAYRGAYDCIHRELNPEGYARAAVERRRERSELARLQHEAAEAERRGRERDREVWAELGGKLD